MIIKFLHILDKVCPFYVRNKFCVSIPHFKTLLVLLHLLRYSFQLRTLLKLTLWLLIIQFMIFFIQLSVHCHKATFISSSNPVVLKYGGYNLKILFHEI